MPLLEAKKPQKMDVKFGTRNDRTLYMTGSLSGAATVLS
jgi:hypothetical protein